MRLNKRLGSYDVSLQRLTGAALLLIVLLTLLLIGCGTVPPPQLNVETIAAERPTRPALPAPKPVTLSKVEWRPVQTDAGPMVALTPDQFRLLSYNLAELLRWMHEAMWRLQYYGAP